MCLVLGWVKAKLCMCVDYHREHDTILHLRWLRWFVINNDYDTFVHLLKKLINKPKILQDLFL